MARFPQFSHFVFTSHAICFLCQYLTLYTLKVVDPSFELKQRTIAGVAKVKPHLDKTKRTRNFNLPPSRLQSGSLKPLGRPMTASGPPMRNCQGIVAGRFVWSIFVQFHRPCKRMLYTIITF